MWPNAAWNWGKTWSLPPIFPFLEEKGEVPSDEMYRTFNMGIGLMAVVDDSQTQGIMKRFEEMGEKPFIIGEIAELSGDNDVEVELTN